MTVDNLYDLMLGALSEGCWLDAYYIAQQITLKETNNEQIKQHCKDVISLAPHVCLYRKG